MAIAALPLLSGCGVYLHSAELETKTAQIKTDFQALKPPAYLDAQRQRATEFAAREDAGVAAFATSARNAALIDYIRPSPLAPEKPGSAQRLLARVETDLATIQPRPWTDDQLNSLADASRLMIHQSQRLAATSSNVLAAIRNFRAAETADAAVAAEKRDTDCAKVKDPPNPIPPDLSPAGFRYIDLQIACREFKFEQAQDSLSAFTGGELGLIVAAYHKAEADKKDAEKRGAELKAQIKVLQGKAQPAPTTEAPDFSKIREVLKSAPPQVRLAGLEAIAETLEPALSVALDPNATVPDRASAETQAIVASLRLIQAANKVAEGFASAPDIEKGDALLIAIADLKHQQNMATLDAAWEDRRIRLLQAQVAAILLQAEQLVRARKLLLITPGEAPARGLADLRGLKTERDRARHAEALTAYAASWDVGKTPYWVLRFKEVQYSRMAAIERAQQTEADTRAVLAPSIDTLAAAGAGGIRKETWVTLLGDLAIAGSILEH